MRGTVSHKRKLDRKLQSGLQHQQSGQLDEAEQCYRQILRSEPNDAEALHLLGVLAQQRGNYQEAVRLIQSAIQYNPAVSDYHVNLGNTYQLQGSISEAIDSYRHALKMNASDREVRHSLACMLMERGDLADAEAQFQQLLESRPVFAETYYNMGNLQSRRGNLQGAVDYYRRAIALKANCFEFHFNLAGTLFALHQYLEAAQSYRQALQIKPKDADALYSLGVALQEHGDLEAAAEAYQDALQQNPNHASALSNLSAVLMEDGKLERASKLLQISVKERPDSPEAHCNLGNMYRMVGDSANAIECFQNALRQDPNHASALSQLGATLPDEGNILMETGQLAKALSFLQRSIAVEPDSPNAHCNLGKLYMVVGEYEKATECFRTSLKLDPTHDRSLCNLACQLEILGDLAASEQCYQIALQHHPDSASARFGLGTMQLAQGKFTEGWPNYEARWKTTAFRGAVRNFTQPQWTGQDIRGARILVYSEQGLGDTMHFARYISRLASRGARAYFEVQKPVYRLLQNLEGAEQVFEQGATLPEFDWQCPLFSLPLAFQTELASIPAKVPYLRPSEQAVQEWSKRLDPTSFRVGVVWSGSPKHPFERYRSVPVAQLAQLSRIPRIALYSLQKGPKASQADELSSGLRIVNLDKEQSDFADTAAIIANLDLVITIDTSVAHLAGGMGKPVWILLHNSPDWRWMRGREDSPWYPTARLFRQRAREQWNDVFDHVGRELRQLVVAHKPANAAPPQAVTPAEWLASLSLQPGTGSAGTMEI